MKLLEVCLRTTYFQVDDKISQQKRGMDMGRSLSPTVSNIYLEHFEKRILDSAQGKPPLWLRYVEDILWSGLMTQRGHRISSATSVA
jgi:hypothetical protein